MSINDMGDIVSSSYACYIQRLEFRSCGSQLMVENLCREACISAGQELAGSVEIFHKQA